MAFIALAQQWQPHSVSQTVLFFIFSWNTISLHDDDAHAIFTHSIAVAAAAPFIDAQHSNVVE